MKTFDTAAAIAAAPSDASLDPALRRLLADRAADWAATDVLDLTIVVVVEAGDTEEDLVKAIDYSPLVDIDGRRFGSADFIPTFDWLSDVGGGYFECIQTIGNDGFAFHVFLPDCKNVDAELIALCRAYADGEE